MDMNQEIFNQAMNMVPGVMFSGTGLFILLCAAIGSGIFSKDGISIPWVLFGWAVGSFVYAWWLIENEDMIGYLLFFG